MSSTELDWFKSSYSGSSGDNCIEVADCPGVVRVRDSKNKEGDQLAVSRTTWSTFVAYAADTRV
ncbi:DUF397 domain-containing protein [Streptomyces sp. NPDC051987]|uniref:DUF397 domain-containing protein n=1 Tax=Streptomyces sp. NPDC051987 TaxID=3155808 RepID=UPI00342FED88